MGNMFSVAGLYTAAHSWFQSIGLPEWAFTVFMAFIKAQLVLVFILVNALFLIWLERKVSGHIQNRIGPMRVGWHGAFQTIADALKLMAKEDIVPSKADRLVFVIAPMLIFAPAMAVYVIIPWTDKMVVQDLNIGLIYLAAITSFTVLSILTAGWSSNNKWSLLGAMRAAAQLVSYEVPLVLSVVGVALMAGSLQMNEIVQAQRDWGAWFILLQPLGFLVFFVASLAELNRAPFDLTEAESELVSGFNTEYSGMRWGIFFLSEYGNLFASSAIAATLFLGGWSGPILPPFVWFLLKTLFFVFVAMWIRWTLPRIRVDQLMEMAWKGLIPLSLVNLVWVSILVLVV